MHGSLTFICHPASSTVVMVSCFAVFFVCIQAPARSLAEHLFLGLSRLSISKKPSPLLKVHVTGGGENPMVRADVFV